MRINHTTTRQEQHLKRVSEWSGVAATALCLLLISLTPRPTEAFQFVCSEMSCTITRWTPHDEGTFLLTHVPEMTVLLKFVNLKANQFNFEILRNATRIGTTVQIVKSPIQRVLVPASINAIFTKLTRTYLREILFERGNALMEGLSIKESRLKSVPATFLTVVRNIEITHSLIEAVNFNLFSKLQHLEQINLCNNKILYLQIAITSDNDFPNLRDVYLADNLLTTVNLHSFSGMRALQTLDFRRNRVARVDGPLVSDNVKSIELSWNRIETMYCCEWNATNMAWFALNYNALAWLPMCLEVAMPNLAYLGFSSNALENNYVRRVVTMKQLKHLDISHNRLTSVEFSEVSFSLQIINLEHNRITRLSLPSVGAGLKLIVSFNAIEQFDLKSLSPNVTSLEMLHNPIDCSFNKELMRSDEEIQCIRTEATANPIDR
uniref:Leucine rich immune protein (Coil-less) n=1 Tax=Anopheles maculatus TaxID=74869 RepID=A0A182SYA2_9DIPT